MGRERTLRGTLPKALNEAERLILDNGSITKNWRVTGFEIYGNGNTSPYGFWNDPTHNNNIQYITVALDENAALARQTFENNAQIGWAACHSATSVDNWNVVLDPNHVIVQDLFLYAYDIDTSDGSVSTISVPLNYKITIEEYESSEAEAVLQLIKERSQDDQE